MLLADTDKNKSFDIGMAVHAKFDQTKVYELRSSFSVFNDALFSEEMTSSIPQMTSNEASGSQ